MFCCRWYCFFELLFSWCWEEWILDNVFPSCANPSYFCCENHWCCGGVILNHVLQRKEKKKMKLFCIHFLCCFLDWIQFLLSFFVSLSSRRNKRNLVPYWPTFQVDFIEIWGGGRKKKMKIYSSIEVRQRSEWSSMSTSSDLAKCLSNLALNFGGIPNISNRLHRDYALISKYIHESVQWNENIWFCRAYNYPK